MNRRSPHSGIRPGAGRLGLVLIALLAVGWGPRHALGAARPGVVRLSGVLGSRSLPDSMIDTFLLIGKKSVPFSVTAARRFTPVPEEGVGILMPMGPGAPRIRLIGPKKWLARIRSAPPGTAVVLLGNLTPSQKLFQVVESSLSPREETDPAPLNGASGPRE